MEFLYPGFLYALAALAIPIAIHLFNFRRFKRIPFTNVRFLQQIKQETQSQNKLKHLLILLSRLLALTFLVLAFAQPYIPGDEAGASEGSKVVSIFVDNSFSMEGEGATGPLIDVAKNKAIDIAMTLSPGDRFHLLTHDFEGKHQRLVSREVFIDWVQQIDLSPHSRSFSEIYARQSDALSQAGGRDAYEIYFISDFQKSRFDLDAAEVDSLHRMRLVHLPRNEPNNLYIDSVWFDTPVRKLNDTEKLQVRVVNAGDRKQERIPLRLEINGQTRSLASVDVDARSHGIARLEFVHESAGLHEAVVEIEDSPINYDDTYFFSFDVYESLSILSITNESRSGDPLRGVFASDSVYKYQSTTAQQVDYSALPSYGLIVLLELREIPGGLSEELRAFVEGGGSLWLIPSADVKPSGYDAFMTAFGLPALGEMQRSDERVREVNVEHPLYRGIFESIPKNMDLPAVRRYYSFPDARIPGADALMSMGGGRHFLSAYKKGRGRLYFLKTSLDSESGNFARHALFVASALRMAELSKATELRSIALDEQASFSIPAFTALSAQNLTLRDRRGQIELIPIARQRDGRYIITPGPAVREAAIYRLYHEDEAISAVGINYAREESDVRSYSSAELAELAKLTGMRTIQVFDGSSERLDRELMRATQGQGLWRYCLLLLLLFLLIEGLLLRLWKA